MNVGLKAKCLTRFVFRKDLTVGKEYDVKGIINDRITIENDLGIIGSYPISWFTVDIRMNVEDKQKVECSVKGEKGDIYPTRIKPDYYNKTDITPFDYIKANQLDFFEGNIIKYVTRHREKNGREDLVKAMTYLEELIKEYDLNE